MAMTPRMAKMWLEAQREEGIDVDAKKAEAINGGIDALTRMVKTSTIPVEEPIFRKVKYVKSCRMCCKLLMDEDNFCPNCGQAILQENHTL